MVKRLSLRLIPLAFLIIPLGAQAETPQTPCPQQPGKVSASSGSGACTGNNAVAITVPNIGVFTYNSTDSKVDFGMGRGIRFESDRQITNNSGQYTQVFGDGSLLPLIASGGSGKYVANDFKLSLCKFVISNTAATETCPDGLVMNYNPGKVSTKIYFISSVTNSHGKQITFTRDAKDHITEIDDVYGNSMTFTYGGTGSKLSQAKDLAGNTYTFVVDKTNHLTQVTFPDGLNWQMSYNGDNLIFQKTPEGQTQTFNYLANGILASTNDFKGWVTKYAYTANSVTLTDSFHIYTENFSGLLMTSSVMDYFTTTYQFNSQNQLTQVTSPSSPTVNYGYDSSGNLNSITWQDAAGTSHSVSRTYAMPGRDITSETTRVGNSAVTTSYLWNNLHQPTQITYRGKSKTLRYNTAGDLLSMTDFTGATVMSATYDGFGNPLTQTDQAGHTTTYTYDNYGYVATITDPLGLVTSMTHDPLGNLIAASYPGGGGSMSRSVDYLGRETGNTTYLGSLRATKANTFSQFASGAPSALQSSLQIGNFNSSTNVAFSSDNPGAPNSITQTTPMGTFNVMDKSTGNFGSAVQNAPFPRVK